MLVRWFIPSELKLFRKYRKRQAIVAKRNALVRLSGLARLPGIVWNLSFPVLRPPCVILSGAQR